jgi:hypothetical protein
VRADPGGFEELAVPLEEDFKVLESKLLQLKLDYDQYFLGSRPREPAMLRGEVQKLIAMYSNQAIQNTALRFKFGSICSRFQAFKRQWNEVLRQIEQGTYSRHRFKAELHERERQATRARSGPARAGGEPDDALFRAYVEASRSCGQDVKGLTPAKLESILEKQREQLRARYGDAPFTFRDAFEDGKAKLKASRTKAAG